MRQAAPKPVESKMKVPGSGVEIGVLPGPGNAPPVAGIMGADKIPGPPIVPPTPPPALASVKDGTALAGVPPPPISPPMDATNGSMIS